MISVAIMGHPTRQHLIDELVGSLDAEPVIVLDEKNNEWDTGRRAIEAFDPAARWHVVLQDDALVCRDLVAGLTRSPLCDRPLRVAGTVIANEPPLNAAIGLYFGQAKPYNGRVARTARRADEVGASWITLPHLHWGVGVVLPVPLIEQILVLGDRTHVLEYDRRLSTVFRKLGMPVWYTWPSLVDHRDERSLLRHDTEEHRRAHRFEGTGWSALSTEWWGGPVLHMPSGNRQVTPRKVTRKRRMVEQ